MQKNEIADRPVMKISWFACKVWHTYFWVCANQLH